MLDLLSVALACPVAAGGHSLVAGDVRVGPSELRAGRFVGCEAPEESVDTPLE